MKLQYVLLLKATIHVPNQNMQMKHISITSTIYEYTLFKKNPKIRTKNYLFQQIAAIQR